MLFIAACSFHSGEQSGDVTIPPSIVNSEWQIQKIGPNDVVAKSTVDITFQPSGTVAGSAGCNRYFGRFEITATELSLSGVGSTSMACEETLMMQEQRYFAALGKITQFVTNDESRLWLLDQTGRIVLDAIRVGIDGLQSPGAFTDSRLSYDCEDYGPVSTRLLAKEIMEFTNAGGRFLLQAVRSASGARYAGENIEFWSKGREALLLLNEDQFRCEQPDRQAR